MTKQVSLPAAVHIMPLLLVVPRERLTCSGYNILINEFPAMPRHLKGSFLCVSTHTGYEPRRLFNVVQFVMNDKEGSGNVSLEGAMQILYLRYGKSLLDAQLEEIFGTSDLNSGTPNPSLAVSSLPCGTD